MKYSLATDNSTQEAKLVSLQLPARSRLQLLADKAGICLSVICIIHCVLTPIVLILLPAMQIIEMWHGSFHIVMAVILPLFAIMAFVPGYRQHGDKRVFKIGAIGFVFILLGALLPDLLGHEWLAPVLTIPGSLFLIRSHLINRSLCACCRTGHGKH